MILTFYYAWEWKDKIVLKVRMQKGIKTSNVSSN